MFHLHLDDWRSYRAGVVSILLVNGPSGCSFDLYEDNLLGELSPCVCVVLVKFFKYLLWLQISLTLVFVFHGCMMSAQSTLSLKHSNAAEPSLPRARNILWTSEMQMRKYEIQCFLQVLINWKGEFALLHASLSAVVQASTYVYKLQSHWNREKWWKRK